MLRGFAMLRHWICLVTGEFEIVFILHFEYQKCSFRTFSLPRAGAILFSEELLLLNCNFLCTLEGRIATSQ